MLTQIIYGYLTYCLAMGGLLFGYCCCCERRNVKQSLNVEPEPEPVAAPAEDEGLMLLSEYAKLSQDERYAYDILLDAQHLGDSAIHNMIRLGLGDTADTFRVLLQSLHQQSDANACLLIDTIGSAAWLAVEGTRRLSVAEGRLFHLSS